MLVRGVHFILVAVVLSVGKELGVERALIGLLADTFKVDLLDEIDQLRPEVEEHIAQVILLGLPQSIVQPQGSEPIIDRLERQDISELKVKLLLRFENFSDIFQIVLFSEDQTVDFRSILGEELFSLVTSKRKEE